MSPYIDCDRGTEETKRNAEETLNQELSLASHLGLVAITFKLRGNIDRTANFAKIIYNKLISSCHYYVRMQDLKIYFITKIFVKLIFLYNLFTNKINLFFMTFNKLNFNFIFIIF